MKFHEEQRLIILVATFTGLYTPSIEKVFKNKFIAVILKYLTLVPISLSGVYACSSLKHLIMDHSHYFAKLYDVAIICAFYLIFYKLVFYNLSNSKIEALFEMWYSSFLDDEFSDRKEDLLRKTKKRANKQIVIMVTQSLVCSLFWCIPPFFDAAKTIKHPTGFPYRHQSPDYELVLSFEMLCTLYNVTGITFDAVLMVLLSLAEVQVIHLKKSLSEIVSTVKVTTDGRMLLPSYPDFDNNNGENGLHWDESAKCLKTNEIERKLKIWITHHQQLISYYKEIGLLFYTPLCLQFMKIVINVCLLLFLNSVGAITGLQTVLSAFFTIPIYAMFYINCRIGDIIKDTSNAIFEDAFSDAWYVYPEQIKKLLHIILMQSQMPLDIVAFDIYPLGARSFFKIFKTSYTFYTFLLQMIKKGRS